MCGAWVCVGWLGCCPLNLSVSINLSESGSGSGSGSASDSASASSATVCVVHFVKKKSGGRRGEKGEGIGFQSGLNPRSPLSPPLSPFIFSARLSPPLPIHFCSVGPSKKSKLKKKEKKSDNQKIRVCVKAGDACKQIGFCPPFRPSCGASPDASHEGLLKVEKREFRCLVFGVQG